jgi:Cof subfamily protein (haloacid dehalogenase superfamily)
MKKSVESLAGGDYRLAFFDVDGTLLGFNGEYTDRLKQALRSVRKRGLKTAIASGRPMFATRFLMDELELVDAGVFYTGAMVYDPSCDRTLNLHPLTEADLNRLISAAAELGIYTEIYTRDHYYIERSHEIADKHSHHLRAEPLVVNFSELPQEPAIKVLMAVSELDQHKSLKQLEEAFPHLVFAYAHLAEEPDWLFVSVISSSACKKQAFSDLLQHYGARPEQVMAFGDAQSDMQFLAMAGAGIAMGNAPAEVQAVADMVTLPVWDDGVAHALEMIL